MKQYLIYILPALVCILAGVANGIMDTQQFHYTTSRILYWDPEYWYVDVSWCRKWKDCTPGIEAFPGSSTVFVAFTDGWHLMKMLYTILSALGTVMFVYCQLFFFNNRYFEAHPVRWLLYAVVVPVALTKLFVSIGFYLAYDLWLPLSISVHNI